MIAACVTLAFVACVASFTTLRVRSMAWRMAESRETSAELDVIRADLAAVAELAEEAKAVAQSAANKAAMGGRR